MTTRRKLLMSAGAAALTATVFPRELAELPEWLSPRGLPIEEGGFYCPGPSLHEGGSGTSIIFAPDEGAAP